MEVQFPPPRKIGIFHAPPEIFLGCHVHPFLEGGVEGAFRLEPTLGVEFLEAEAWRGVVLEQCFGERDAVVVEHGLEVVAGADVDGT